jgi:hypothetical protein
MEYPNSFIVALRRENPVLLEKAALLARILSLPIYSPV